MEELEKILLVDDESNILDAYRRTLRGKFDVDTALSGHEALEMVANHGPYAVIVTDLRMPGMDGIELMEKLKEVAPSSVRMIVSGYGDRESAYEAVSRGNVFYFLNKPCPADKLIKAVEACAKLHNLHAQIQQVQNFIQASA